MTNLRQAAQQALEALESDSPYLRQLAANAEAAAKALYETWHSQPEYKPWQDGGNSQKQDEARELVRLAAHKLKPPLPVQPAQATSGWSLRYVYFDEDGIPLMYREPEERNFCQRCGKRTADLTTIHTCTPPQENT